MQVDLECGTNVEVLRTEYDLGRKLHLIKFVNVQYWCDSLPSN